LRLILCYFISKSTFFWVFSIIYNWLFAKIFLNYFSSVKNPREGISTIFSVFFLLIPPPFIDLRLRKSCNIWQLVNFLFIPYWLDIKLFFQNMNLDCTFSFSYFSITLFLFFIIFQYVCISLLFNLFFELSLIKFSSVFSFHLVLIQIINGENFSVIFKKLQE